MYSLLLLCSVDSVVVSYYVRYQVATMTNGVFGASTEKTVIGLNVDLVAVVWSSILVR